MGILFAIIIFAFLVFVHELGHFLAAKASGVQVNEFSLFMGPAIFKKKIGQTLYAIRCIPFGGYCAMEGEDEDTDNPRSFQKAAWWKRVIILVAGSAMNFLTGLVLLAALYAPSDAYIAPIIAEFEDYATVDDYGLEVGDRIMEIDGEKILLMSDVEILLTLHKGDYHDLVVQRDGQLIELDNFYLERHDVPQPDGTTARLCGFSYGQPVEFTFGTKLQYLWYTAVDWVRSVAWSLEMLVTGQAGLTDMSGPVGIVQQMSEVADTSESVGDAMMNLLYFGAFIAVNLSVMNLLPLPALDGGRVVCLLITTAAEAITRKKINPKYEGYLHLGGMILLLILMAVITFKDIFTIFR